ncbi:MAG: alpha/beta hydrolase [Deltaproteobacteria bacterium]|nr:alpha/beta hydrolase [Deltaproteobacteria bacterium]
MLGGALSISRLARWLGPWADPRAAPNVPTEDASVDQIRVRIYRPRGTPRRTYLIAPGLHYAGPDDPRMDRFCRILAAGGQLVIAPFIPSYLALTPNARAIADFETVFRALPRWSTQKPIVFSISFGSLLAFALAAKHGSAIDHLVIFGGYADFDETLQFCLTGTLSSGRAAPRDPLNQPVVLINLLPHLEPPCADPDAVVSAWNAYIHATWGRPEMKARERFTAAAAAIAVPAHVQALYDIGIGVAPGATELALSALTRFDSSALDPMPYLPRITNRVELVHGVDDDVIPYEHSHALAKQLVNADVRVHVTGLYGHTGAQRPKLSDAVRELVTMVRVLRVLAG